MNQMRERKHTHTHTHTHTNIYIYIYIYIYTHTHTIYIHTHTSGGAFKGSRRVVVLIHSFLTSAVDVVSGHHIMEISHYRALIFLSHRMSAFVGNIYVGVLLYVNPKI